MKYGTSPDLHNATWWENQDVAQLVAEKRDHHLVRRDENTLEVFHGEWISVEPKE